MKIFVLFFENDLAQNTKVFTPVKPSAGCYAMILE